MSCDIGCHLFSILPPFNIGATTMGYGLGGAGASAFNAKADKRAIAFMGDGGFWHNGLTSGDRQRGVQQERQRHSSSSTTATPSATGGQDILSSTPTTRSARRRTRSRRRCAASASNGCSTLTRTYDVAGMRDTLREALTTKEKGPKVIVAQSECMLNKQRRVRPLMKQGDQGRRARGARALRRRCRHLHRRSFLHPPVGLPVADDRAESRSAAHASRSPR